MTFTRRAQLMAGIVVVFAGASGFVPVLANVVYVLAALAIAAFVLDALIVRRISPPGLIRRAPSAYSIGEWHDVGLRLVNRGESIIRCRVFDHSPRFFATKGMPRNVVVGPRGWLELDYKVRPQQRGDFFFQPASVRLRTAAGLIERDLRIGETESVRVYPNFKSVARYVLLAAENQTQRLGLHQQRRRGEGSEFHQLREYREGDSLRKVDWKASSRRNQLVSREYREKRSQNIVFVLDCGRGLRAAAGEVSHFDHALNALILVGTIATRQGDSAGLLTFSGPERWLPPSAGPAAQTQILHTLYDLEPTTAPSDYAAAARGVAIRQRRRSLIVVVTDLRDDEVSSLIESMRPLQVRHLVLIACIRLPDLDDSLTEPIKDFDDALRIAAMHGYLEKRAKALAQLAAAGLMTVDSLPEELPVALANKYLEIKRSGRL